MQAVEVQTMARQMFEALGPKAVAEAAQKAQRHERKGEIDKAREWRQIEAALLHLRGPRAS